MNRGTKGKEREECGIRNDGGRNRLCPRLNPRHCAEGARSSGSGTPASPLLLDWDARRPHPHVARAPRLCDITRPAGGENGCLGDVNRTPGAGSRELRCGGFRASPGALGRWVRAASGQGCAGLGAGSSGARCKQGLFASLLALPYLLLDLLYHIPSYLAIPPSFLALCTPAV